MNTVTCSYTELKQESMCSQLETVPKDLLQQSNYIKCNIHIYRFTKTLLNKKILKCIAT